MQACCCAMGLYYSELHLRQASSSGQCCLCSFRPEYYHRLAVCAAAYTNDMEGKNECASEDDSGRGIGSGYFVSGQTLVFIHQ